jgi:hypothetical protein
MNDVTMSETMKLISRHIKMNHETHTPEMEVVFTLPMEFAIDALCRTEEQFEKQLGKQLVELLRSKE